MIVSELARARNAISEHGTNVYLLFHFPSIKRGTKNLKQREPSKAMCNCSRTHNDFCFPMTIARVLFIFFPFPLSSRPEAQQRTKWSGSRSWYVCRWSGTSSNEESVSGCRISIETFQNHLRNESVWPHELWLRLKSQKKKKRFFLRQTQQQGSRTSSIWFFSLFNVLLCFIRDLKLVTSTFSLNLKSASTSDLYFWPSKSNVIDPLTLRIF